MINSNPNKGTYCAPLVRERSSGVTIRDIEHRLRELNPAWTDEAVRIASVLFAILKEGCSTRKLLAFTRYPSEFLMNHVECLRQRGELFTGTLSSQFVTQQVPGAEDLVERITGQRLTTTKEVSRVSETTNGHASSAQVKECHASGCAKPKGHTGRHTGAQKQTARKRRTSARAALQVAQATSDAEAPKVSFSIVYIDNEVEVRLKGDSMPKLKGALELLNRSLNLATRSRD